MINFLIKSKRNKLEAQIKALQQKIDIATAHDGYVSKESLKDIKEYLRLHKEWKRLGVIIKDLEAGKKDKYKFRFYLKKKER